jgi:hypothetical protein
MNVLPVTEGVASVSFSYAVSAAVTSVNRHLDHQETG